MTMKACYSGERWGTCCGHASDVEILLPLLLDPLKGEGIADLVALLRIPGPLAHHHQ